jgi:hypothetical protein
MDDLKSKQDEIVGEAMELLRESGRIPYKCQLKILTSRLTAENGEVREV